MKPHGPVRRHITDNPPLSQTATGQRSPSILVYFHDPSIRSKSIRFKSNRMSASDQSSTQQAAPPTLNVMDLLLTLARYRWRVVQIVLVVTVAALGVSLIWPKTFKSTTRFVQYNATAGGALGGLISSFVQVPTGSDRVSIDQALVILRSQTMLDAVAERFDLAAVYGTSTPELIREQLSANTLIEETREGGIGFNPIVAVTLSVYDRDPALAQSIARFYLEQLDSLMVRINGENAQRMLESYEARYLRNLEDLKVAEDALVEFQKTYGILELESQLSTMIQTAAQLKAELVALDVQISATRSLTGPGSISVVELESRRRELENAYNDMIRRTDQRAAGEERIFEEGADVFPALMEYPDLGVQYLRLFREVTVQQRVYELLFPQYEQKKLEMEGLHSGLTIIDEPNLPQYKDKPKRAFIVVAGFLFGLFASFVSVTFSEFVRRGGESGGRDFEAYLELRRTLGSK